MQLHSREWWIIGTALFIVMVLVVLGNQKRGVGGDFRVAVINDNGVFLRSVSSSRKMVNLMDINPEVRLWIPEGLGWYRAGTIKKILTKENKLQLIDKMFFYNFGYIPHVIEFGNEDEWLSDSRVPIKWGIINYLQFRINEASMMTKREVLKEEIATRQDYLNEVMPRDFADSNLLQEDLKVSVYNQSDSSGLASFVARSLEWGGVTIIGVDNYVGKLDKCIVNYGSNVPRFKGFTVLKEVFDKCQFSLDKEMADSEAEITMGNNFAQMLNYQSYNISN